MFLGLSSATFSSREVAADAVLGIESVSSVAAQGGIK